MPSVNRAFTRLSANAVQLNINQQPLPVSGDTSFCQGTGFQVLAGKGTSDNTTLEWLDLENAYPDSLFTDSLLIKTDKQGEKLFLVRQTTLNSHCSSDPAPMTVTIHPAIQPLLKDTTVCDGSLFDFEAYAQRLVSEGTEPYLFNTRRTEPILPIDYNAIRQGGRFIAHYKDVNGCEAKDTMTLTYAPKIEIQLDYKDEVCAGETIVVKADGADHFVWNQTSNDMDSILIITEKEGIQEIGLTASNVINTAEDASCSIDTLIRIKVNKVPDLLTNYGDTAYCQNAPTEALSLQASDPNAVVLWYDPNDNYETVSKNGTLKPSSLYAGEYTYKFRQQLIKSCLPLAK